MENRTVVITGAHGFIGRYTACYYASQGWKVIGVGHGKWGEEQWQQWGIAQWHECDINVAGLVSLAVTPAVIVHCAGSGSVRFSIDNPVKDFERTIKTTQAVLEYMRIYSPKSKMVYVSSAAVYGVSAKIPTPEDCTLKPVSPYGVHKKIAEDMCLLYASQYGLSVVMIRPFSVYGAGLCKQLLWDACGKIDRGEFCFFGTGKESRDWVHVTDVASLLFLAHGYAAANCPVVNGGSGTGVSIKDVLLLVFKYYGVKETPVFTGRSPEGDPPYYAADVACSQEWGWTPQVDLQTGIQKYVEWYKKVTQ